MNPDMLTQWWTLVTRTHTQRDSNSGNWVQQTVVKRIQNAPRWSAHHWWSQRWFLQTASHAKPNQNQANAHLRNSVHFKSNTQKRGGGLWTAERMIAERIQKKIQGRWTIRSMRDSRPVSVAIAAAAAVDGDCCPSTWRRWRCWWRC